MFEYPIDITKDSDGSFLVKFSDVPEAVTFGDTREEALTNASEALEAALSFYIDDWRKLPNPSPQRRRAYTCPSLKGTMKLAVYKTMRDDNIRKTDLARRMGVAMMQIDRLLDLTHSSRIEQLELALEALGKRVHMEMEPA